LLPDANSMVLQSHSGGGRKEGEKEGGKEGGREREKDEGAKGLDERSQFTNIDDTLLVRKLHGLAG